MKHMTMQLPLLTLVLLHLLSFGGSSLAPTTVDDYCQSLAASYIDPQSCVNILGADPGSCTASRNGDYQGLAVIAVNLTIANATAVRSTILSLIASNTSSTTPKGLRGCLDLYSNSIPSLRRSADFLASDNFGAAQPIVHTIAFTVPSRCDDFARSPLHRVPRSALQKKNDGFFAVAVLADAIVTDIGSWPHH